MVDVMMTNEQLVVLQNLENDIRTAAEGVAIAIHNPKCTYIKNCPSMCVCGAVRHLNVVTALSWDIMVRVLNTCNRTYIHAYTSEEDIQQAHTKYKQMSVMIHILAHGTSIMHHPKQFKLKLRGALEQLLYSLRAFDRTMYRYEMENKEKEDERVKEVNHV